MVQWWLRVAGLEEPMRQALERWSLRPVPTAPPVFEARGAVDKGWRTAPVPVATRPYRLPPTQETQVARGVLLGVHGVEGDGAPGCCFAL